MSQKRTKKQRKLEKQNDFKVINHVGADISIIKILKQNWKFLLILCLLVFGVYFNSLKGDFVSDDYASITQNPLVNNAGYMVKGLNSVYISTYLTAVMFGVNSPIAYHLFSLVLYLISVIVSFIFLHIIFGRKMSLIASLLFAFHPIHVEAVSWISGRPYLFLLIYTLLSLIFFIKYLGDLRFINLFWCGIFFILGFLTDKPRPFALFILIGLYLFYKKINIKKIKLFNYWPIILGVFVVAVFLAWPTIMSRIGSVNSGYNSSGNNFYNPFFQYPTAIAKYLQLLFVPVDLTLYHTLYILPVQLNWVILLIYLISIIYFYFKDKRFFFALVFIFAAAAPSMAPVKVSWLVAERYIFLGSLGFCLFLALILENLEKYKLLSKILLFSLLLMYGTRTVIRNIDWQTNHNLWVNTVQVSPNSHNAWNNIGDDYDKLGQYENAVKGFTQSTVVKTNYADAFHNRANILYKIGRYDLARDSYETALKFSPQLNQTYISLIQIDLVENRGDLALQHAQKLVQIQPNSFQSHYILGVVLAQTGNIDGAMKELKYTLQLYPGYKPADDLIKSIQSKQVLNKQ